MSKQLFGMALWVVAGALVAGRPSSTPVSGGLGESPQVVLALVADGNSGGPDGSGGSDELESGDDDSGSDEAGVDTSLLEARYQPGDSSIPESPTLS